jgi:hypothetical protein
MRKAVLAIAAAIITLAMLATPVLAIGPENAYGKNPKVALFGSSDYYMLNEIRDVTSGVVIEWVQEVPISPELSAILLTKDARIFHINNAFVITSPVQVLQMENTWLYLSQSMLYNFFVFVGVPPSVAASIAEEHPEGIYFKRNIIGQ